MRVFVWKAASVEQAPKVANVITLFTWEKLNARGFKQVDGQHDYGSSISSQVSNKL